MFYIDQKSHKSICDQIIDNYKELIVMNVLEYDEKMPSVRELSKTLRVNPNTVQKAYKKLEEQKYIYVSKGRGTFVSNDYEKEIDIAQLREIEIRLADDISKLFYLGVTADKAREIIEGIIAGREEWK
ncbi:MAG: GntR family transcriptional regulator [Anaerovoracaceae bacterium]